MVEEKGPTLNNTKTSKLAMRSIAAALNAASGSAQGRCFSRDFGVGRTSTSWPFLTPGEGDLKTVMVRLGAGTLMTLATLARPCCPISDGTRKNSVESS